VIRDARQIDVTNLEVWCFIKINFFPQESHHADIYIRPAESEGLVMVDDLG